MKIEEYKAEKNCFKKELEIIKKRDQEGESLDEVYKKTDLELKGKGRFVFEKTKEFFEQSRNFIITECEVFKIYLDVIKYHYDVLSDCKKAMEQHEVEGVRAVSGACDDLKKYIAERFEEYYELYIQFKSVENQYKVKVNEFINFRKVDSTLSQADAVKSMSEASVKLTIGGKYIKNLLQMPFMQTIMFAKKLNVKTSEIDEAMLVIKADNVQEQKE